MTNRNNQKNNDIIMCTIDELIPQDYLVRILEAMIDWKFIYPLVRSLYSNLGRRSIDPVALFKMIFINYTFGINSMRKTCEEIMAYNTDEWKKIYLQRKETIEQAFANAKENHGCDLHN